MVSNRGLSKNARVEKSARRVISKYNLCTFLALMLTLHVRRALTKGHREHMNMKLVCKSHSKRSRFKKKEREGKKLT